MRTRLAAAGLAALGCLGCDADSPATASLDDSTYVEVTARLAFIRQHAEGSRSPDTVRWADSSRLAVLDDYGVDGDMLERYAARHGHDPVHMERIWEHVADVVDALAARAARSEGPVELGRDAGRAAPDTADPRPAGASDTLPAGASDTDRERASVDDGAGTP